MTTAAALSRSGGSLVVRRPGSAAGRHTTKKRYRFPSLHDAGNLPEVVWGIVPSEAETWDAVAHHLERCHQGIGNRTTWATT